MRVLFVANITELLIGDCKPITSISRENILEIFPRILSARRSEHFFESVAREKLCASRNRYRPRTNRRNIFTLNGGYCVYYPSIFFSQHLQLILKIEEYHS